MIKHVVLKQRFTYMSKRIGVFILLIANYGMQVEGGKKTPNENEATKAESVTAPEATDKGTGQEILKEDNLNKQVGKEDSSGKNEDIPSDSSHEKDEGRKSSKAKPSGKNENQEGSKKKTKEEAKEVNGIETTVQTTNSDHKQEKKPGIITRVSSKLPFRKSNKKVNPATNTADEGSNKVTGTKEDLMRKDTPGSSSSGEANGGKQKVKVGISETEKDSGKELDELNSKGAEKSEGQTKEGSSSSESEGTKHKSNPKGKTSHKHGMGALKENNVDKDLSSGSSSDEQKQSEKQQAEVKTPKTGPPKTNSNTENEINNKEAEDKNKNDKKAADQPQGEKKSGMLGKLIHRPHLPGPNIYSLLSRKDKQQTAQ